jgi:hypothetical protein
MLTRALDWDSCAAHLTAIFPACSNKSSQSETTRTSAIADDGQILNSPAPESLNQLPRHSGIAKATQHNAGAIKNRLHSFGTTHNTLIDQFTTPKQTQITRN